ncbi:MAG: tetratricopeptide repeat protein [Pirellulaceae bacterium]|nr:tetratricopeptide repeat protein [Pirellulaceae bacterium]
MKAEEETKARAAELEQLSEFQSRQLSEIDVPKMGSRLRETLMSQLKGSIEKSKLTDDQRNHSLDEFDASLKHINFVDVSLSVLSENILQRALSTIESDYKDQPLFKATMLTAIGTTAEKLGLWTLALQPLQEALSIREHELGLQHPNRLTSVTIFAALLMDQGKYSEAEPLFLEALEVRRRTLGDEHPNTLASINNMAVFYWIQGKQVEAEPLFREALDGQRKCLGAEHRDTLRVLGNLGCCLTSQKRFDEAEPLLRDAVEGLRRELGDKHPSTLSFISHLAHLCWEQKKFAEAEVLYREEIQGRREVMGLQHEDTMNSIQTLGTLLLTMERAADAEILLREAVEGLEKCYPGGHATLTQLRGLLGRSLYNLERFEEAIPYFEGNAATKVADLKYLLNSFIQLDNREEIIARTDVFIVELRNSKSTVATKAGRLQTMAWALNKIEAFDKSEPIAREALELANEAKLSDWILARAEATHAIALLGLGRTDEAKPMLEAAYPRLLLEDDKISNEDRKEIIAETKAASEKLQK